MKSYPKIRVVFIFLLLTTFLMSACNLTSAPEEQISLTTVATGSPQPTRTLIPTSGIPTPLSLTRFVIPTSRPGQIPPTTIYVPPTFVASAPTSTPLPISIVILSPIPGNVVAGNVQVVGSAIHPQFLQYQLEYGPDSNPSNLWYPAGGIIQTPIINNVLGYWNTTAVQDGLYQLRLRVYLRDGSSLSTVVYSIRIQNQVPTPVPSNTPNIPRPIAAFNLDQASGQAPLVIRFANQSSGNITSYSWSFGDGGTSPDPNPIYTFRSPGVYNTTLTVTGPGGSSNVSRQINVQSATAPIAGFSQDKTTGPAPLTVKFTNQSTGSITTYAWNFGDGGTANEANPTHQFTAVGTYNVILTVTGAGGSSSVTRKITVQDPAVPVPVAAFKTDVATGDAPLKIQFINQSTGQLQSFSWDFGDGSTSTDINPVHTYANPGNYTAKLTAIGPGGQNTAQTTITVTQKPNAPVAGFTQDTAAGNAPLTVQFTDKSEGTITTYAWDFGDGQKSADRSPNHVFNAPGTYTVTLTVTGPGGTDDAQTTISAAQPITPPDAAFQPNPATGNAPLIVQFTNQSSGQNLDHTWEFGDNTTSTEVSPSHEYANAGTYTVRLTVKNDGGTDTAEAQITVSAPAPAAPVAAFTADPTTGSAPLPVQFTSQSTGQITGYSWNFGDGNTSTDQNPQHTFETANTYEVSLTVTGPGGENTTTGTITVNAPAPAAPVAAFTADPTTGSAPLPVQFTSQSTGEITGYSWNFGDGNTSTDQNPQHTFETANTYEVSLTVTGPGGENTTTSTITVNAPAPAAPVAAFTADPTSGSAPLPVQFTSQSTGEITGYSWNFGDGNTSTDQNPQHTFETANTYEVSLTVTGPGGENTATTTITVSDSQPPQPSINNTIAFISNRDGNNEIYTLSPDGTLTNLTNNPADDTSPAWSPDGSRIVFVSKNRDGVADNEIYVMNADGSNVTNLTNNPADDNTPVWSADGSKIIFVTNRDGNLEIYAMNPDGTEPQNITQNPAQDFDPAVVDDGSFRLAFVSTRDNNNDDIFVMSTDGVATNITNNPADDTSPAWSPDGSRIVFVSNNRDGIANNEIYVMNADGSNATNLTNDSANDTSPAWSPDNTQIVFVTNRDGNNELYIMNTDGSAPANLTNNGADDTNPDWQS